MKPSRILRLAFPAAFAFLQVLAICHPCGARAQGPIATGEMQLGTIFPSGDEDHWTFNVVAGEAIVVRVGETSGSADFTPRLRLLDPGASQVDVSWGFVAAEVAHIAAASGTYTVVVDDLADTAATGSYRLTLAQSGSAVSVSSGDEGGPLTNGALHTGTISVGDLDVWTVSAVAGEALVARVGQVSGGGGYAPQVRIYHPAGSQQDVSWGNDAAEVAVVAATGGTFLVVVGDQSSGLAGSGEYRLTLAQSGSAVSVSSGDEGGPLTNGALHTGTISVGDLDVWTVSAVAGEALVARVGQVSGGGGYAPQVRIYRPAGSQQDVSWGNDAAEVAVVAATGGTFLVVVGDQSSGLAGSGEYRLTLAQSGSAVSVSSGDEGGPLTNGALHTGTISVGDLDVWTVSAVAGEALVARVGQVSGGGGYAPQVRIYRPAGSQQDVSWGNDAAEVAVVAATGGTFLVVVGDQSSGLAGSGEYRLTLAQSGSAVSVSSGDEGGPLTNGALHTGTIDVGDLDVWTLSANAGQAITVTMSEVDAGSLLSPQLRIYRPAGAQLDVSWGGASATVSVIAPVTGTYLLVAGDQSGGLAQSGRYRLTTGATVDVPSGPLSLELMLAPATPNPFSNRTILRYRVPQAAATALRVFDPQGRLVRTLVDESLMTPGEHEASWDGRDGAGQRVPPGIYLARLDSGGRPLRRKLTLTP